jgi:hypothetical protein
MEWKREMLYGQFVIERWAVRIPNIGRLQIEHTDMRSLNSHRVWKVTCQPLELRHDVIAETPEDAQRQALEFLRGKLIGTLEAIA